MCLITLCDSREKQKLVLGDFKEARVAEGVTKLQISISNPQEHEDNQLWGFHHSVTGEDLFC